MIELCCEYFSVQCIWLYVIIMSRAIHSEEILYIFLSVKELIARNRHDIWILSYRKRTRTHNHLGRIETFNYLAKLAK